MPFDTEQFPFNGCIFCFTIPHYTNEQFFPDIYECCAHTFTTTLNEVKLSRNIVWKQLMQQQQQQEERKKIALNAQ